MEILIVDDNVTNLLVLAHLARRVPDVTVETVTDGPAALEICARRRPDLIITDYMMPGMDGLALIGRLRQDPRLDDIPLIMITTANDRAVRQQALEGGATDFLTKPVEPSEFTARVRNLLALSASQRRVKEQSAHELVVRLSRAAEYRDPETAAHLERMSRYTRLIAARIGLDVTTQERLQIAAPMHDIGKVGIPDDILLKPGRYTAEEFEVMKKHPGYGFEILQASDSPVVGLAAEIALNHHEKLDGSGYPRGLAGADIPLSGRIVAVADVFDALTTVRPYKKAWPLDRAVTFLKDNAGSHFDPVMVSAFLECWDEVLDIRNTFQDGEDVSDPEIRAFSGVENR